MVLGLRTARGAGKHPSGKKSQNSTFGKEKTTQTNKEETKLGIEYLPIKQIAFILNLELSKAKLS